MFVTPSQLRRSLRQAGISNAAIAAAWPDWWSEAAAQSASANAELRFTLARRLGLSPSSLLEEEPVFLWRDEAKYKSLNSAIGNDEAALTSFGLIVGKLALSATRSSDIPDLAASSIRAAILSSHEYVDLRALLLLSWSLGIPVVHLKVFPLDSKNMHAMTVGIDGRFAILLAQNSPFSARHAFTLAHELGHIFLGHFAAKSAIVDMTDPVIEQSTDDEELAANRFALELLTGHPEFEAQATLENYNSAQLASAAMATGPSERIEPGMLALSLGHTTKRWMQTTAALKQITTAQAPAPQMNSIAELEMDWVNLSIDSEGYLRRVLGLGEPNLA